MKPFLRSLARLPFVIFLLCVCLHGHASAREVELMVEGDILQPSTTLEIRFARDMVSQDLLGVAVTPSPIVLEPPIAGSFTWLSRRSGVYVPNEPPRMAQTYTLTLLPGLTDAAGKPIATSLKVQLKTPPFDLVPGEHGSEKTPPTPSIQLNFNRDVKLEGAERLFHFVNGDHQIVAASVQYATLRNSYSASPQNDWDEAWRAAQSPSADPPAASDDDEAHRDEPQRSRLIVEPATPLWPGGDWRLEFAAGLEALRGGYKITKPHTFKLGQVEPFTVASFAASSYLNSGRSVRLEFSSGLSPEITTETAGKFLRVSPSVPDLRFEEEYQALTIHGSFDPRTEYRLEIDPSFTSDNGLPLSGDRARAFRFGPIKPRVYFPAISGSQLAGGRRQLPVQSTNLKSLHVTARLVAPEDAAKALNAFAAYLKEYDQNAPDEKYQQVDPALIPGKIVFDRIFPFADPKVDARQETTLNWDDLLGPQVAGMIFVTADGMPIDSIRGKHPAAQTLVQLTDLGVLWKKAGDRLSMNVFSMATAKPAVGVRLTLITDNFAPGASVASDALGAAELPLDGHEAWLLAVNGADSHAFKLGEGEELPMAAFHLPIFYGAWNRKDDAGPPLRALIFTDRPLYRTAETVHVKGMARYLGAKGLLPESDRTGSLLLQKPHEQGETVIKIQTDQRGSFDVDIPLDSSTVGGYGLQLKFEGRDDTRWEDGFHTSFEVADFQPNAFEINLSAPARFKPDANVAFDVHGKYFFGAPLGASRLRWTLQYFPERYYTPEGMTEFTFGDPEADAAKTLTLRGEGDLAAGAFVIHPRLPDALSGPYGGRLTVEVTDINQQTVSGIRDFKRDAADFYLGLKQPDDFVIGHDEEMPVRAVAVSADGQPWPEPIKLKVELIRVVYHTVRAQGAGKAATYRTERTEEPVVQAEGLTLKLERFGKEWALPEGETARFKPGRAGSYLIRVTAHDSNGRSVASNFRFDVSGSEPIAWNYRNPAQVDLRPDKAEYHAGDRARILVKTPISGDALVTVERQSHILRTMHVHLEGNAPTLEIPLLDGDAPNVFVFVTLLRGANDSNRKFKAPEYRYGVCEIHVSDPVTALKVEVTPKAPSVQPGDEVETEILVRNGGGEPEPGAEVTFFAVDDGILALTGYERPKPRPLFEAPFPLAVRTGLTLFELLPEDPSDLQFANKGYLIGGGGLEGPGIKLRRNFPGTLCWFPSLKTDVKGKVVAKFKAPDALTRYRLVAVAAAGPNRFGSGESAFTINKKLMILSGLGQIANVGDEIVARAVVRNESGAAGLAEVTLALDKTAEPAGGPLTARLELKSGAAGTIDFPVRLRRMGDAEWKWSAHLAAGGKSFDDGVVAQLKIGSPSPVLKETYLGDLHGKSNNLLDGVNPQLIEGFGTVNVALSNTRLASLHQSAKELLEYPYGCAEQTASSIIPWLTIGSLGPVLPELASQAERKTAIEAGIAKLFSMQTPSGGLAYWPGPGRPDLFASAYGALVLSLAEKQGCPLPAGWEKLLKYVSDGLRGNGAKTATYFAPDDYALAVFALAAAGKAEPAYHEQLFNRRETLSGEGRALLACAILQAKGDPQLVAKLLDPRSAAVESDSYTWFGSPTRERALRLMAWLDFKKGHREIPRLVRELLAARVYGHWRTTQENAWAMLALARYFAENEGGVKPVSGSLVKAGVESPFALTTQTLTHAIPFTFDPGAPLGSLEARNPSQSALYGELDFVVRPPVADQPRQDRGYAVSRSYFQVQPDGSLKKAASFAVGDRVVVVLRLETPIAGHFVAIDDPLPAIFDAINPAFHSREIGELPDSPGIDWIFGDYREVRADRVMYFADHLPPGVHGFSYLARVRAAGKVRAPATKVEEMYRPERFGLSATDILESRALK